jgi:putative phage-type endonuclease
MKIIKLEQGTPEWLNWRKTVITATDASCIMGNNPWTTPYKCWQRKLGLVEEQKSNDAMERGKRLEPEARAQFIERYDLIMEPQVVESSEYEFLGASLDGITFSGTKILEIKCGGAKLHDMAARGEIPDYYMDQMQHQLLVTGAEMCYYYSYDGKDGICIEVKPDPEFKAKFLPKARAFWKGVAFFEAPPLQDKDMKDMKDNLDWKEYSRLYQETDAQIKALEDKKDFLRKKLIELCADQSCIGGGLKVIKTLVRGRVAYDEIPEIKGVDLDKYRKDSTLSWKILVEEKK